MFPQRTPQAKIASQVNFWKYSKNSNHSIQILAIQHVIGKGILLISLLWGKESWYHYHMIICRERKTAGHKDSLKVLVQY